MTLLRAAGDARFEPPIDLTGGDVAQSRYIDAGDFDGDGLVDVATAGGDVLYGVGRGPDGVPIARELAAQVPAVARGVAVADIDGDGRDDIVIARSASVSAGAGGGELIVLRNLGSRGWEPVAQPALFDLCDLLESVAAADLDGDGDIDLAVTIQGESAAPCAQPGVRILRGDGRGLFEPASFVPFESRRPRWITTADFDRDGRLDLAVALDDAVALIDEIAIVRNESESSPRDLDLNGVPDVCQFVRGDADIDQRVTISDAVSILRYLFLEAPAPSCLEAADVDNDGLVGLSDAIRVLLFLFQAGPPPEEPTMRQRGACTWAEWDDPNGLLPCEYLCQAR